MIAPMMALSLVQSQAATPVSAFATTPTTAPAPAQIPWATQFDMASSISGRTYRIYVAKPLGTPPKDGWPVVYVLDADVTFASLAAQGAMRSLTGHGGALIVGVAYPNAVATMSLRNRDLTPSQPNTTTTALGGFISPKEKDFGGAGLFHRFMMEELRPRIAATNLVDLENQTLIGYSLGGLFALHVLFNHPNAYRTFVAGSPSIWWNDREVLKDEAAFDALVNSGKVAPRILITSDQWEQDIASPEIPISGPGRDLMVKGMNAARMVDNAHELAARLGALRGAKGYVVHYALFPEETHNSGIPSSANRGLVFSYGP